MRIALGFLLVTLLSGSSLFAQDYSVIHVKGEIERSKTGELLKPGDKVSPDEEINFKSKDAMAAVLNPDMGRFILKAQQDEENTGALIYVLKNTVTPVRGGMSTRAGGINNAFDMKVYFADASYVWAGNHIVVRVSKAAFPMDENNFFFLRYTWKGDMINKKIGYEEDKLMMLKEEIFKVDGAAIDPFEADNFELHYYKSAVEESNLITEVDFVLISQSVLLNIYEAFKDRSKAPFNDVADMLTDMYGKCDPVQIEYNIKNN